MGTDRYAHLLPAVRAMADEADDVRIRRIRTDRWIGYPRAEVVLTAFEELLSFPKRIRMPNLLLVGPTNNGKSMIVEKFRRSHLPVEARAGGGIAGMPVLKIQMPSAPNESRFFSLILDALRMPMRSSARPAVQQDFAVRMMRATGVRMLIIDEAGNLLTGSPIQQRHLLTVLRWIGNELQIPVVAAGTAEALHAVHSDHQLANRFEPFTLPLWQDNEQFRRVLNTLEAVLPLRSPSDLARPALARRIFAASEGILGEVVTLVTRAAERAVVSGKESISLEVIDKTTFTPPSERRRVAV